jgi:hypothetical protein
LQELLMMKNSTRERFGLDSPQYLACERKFKTEAAGMMNTSEMVLQQGGEAAVDHANTSFDARLASSRRSTPLVWLFAF